MRKQAHFQDKEVLLENFIRSLRINKVKKLIPPKSKVLDIGCGYEGYFLQKIESHLSLGMGLDIDIKSNIKSKKIKLKKFKLLKTIPEKDSSFDVVVALAILEHLEYPQNILEEIKRVLKPEGICILTTPHKRIKPLLEFLSFKLGIISKDEIKDHKQYFDKPELLNILINAGFGEKGIELSSFIFGMNLLAVTQKH